MRFLFQPAEEGGLGALEMIKEGALGDAEAISWMHVSHEKPTGRIASRSGPLLAAVCTFEARIEGKGRDAAEPHTNVDPILAASLSILALQQPISRELDPLDSQVCSYFICHFGTYKHGCRHLLEPFEGALRQILFKSEWFLKQSFMIIICSFEKMRSIGNVNM